MLKMIILNETYLERIRCSMDKKRTFYLHIAPPTVRINKTLFEEQSNYQKDMHYLNTKQKEQVITTNELTSKECVEERSWFATCYTLHAIQPA